MIATTIALYPTSGVPAKTGIISGRRPAIGKKMM